jgi:glycosyltransferase involved in cell wall biosynthesis
MKILISALSRFTSPTGLCRHAANLASCLNGLDSVSAITFVCGSWQDEYYRDHLRVGRHAKVTIRPITIANSSLRRNRWFYYELPELARAIGADIVHATFPIPISRSRFRCPIVSTIHDLYPYDLPENFGYPAVLFNRIFLRSCAKNSDALTCVSDATRTRLLELFPSIGERAVRIYNAVDFGDVQASEPAWAGSDPFILSVAQHRRNKNLDIVIKAFERCAESDTISAQTKLLLVGSPGPDSPRVTALVAASKFRDRIQTKANVSDPELLWLYRNCRAFVAASSIEGFCLPLVEALNAGANAICSDIPIFREIVATDSGCAFFSLESNPVDTLSELLARQPVTRVAHPVVLERYYPARLANEYDCLYRGLAAPMKAENAITGWVHPR